MCVCACVEYVNLSVNHFSQHIDDALTHPDVSVEMVSAAIRIASQYNRHVTTAPI